MVMKPGKVLCCVFLFGFLVLTVYKTQQLFISGCEANQKQRFGYVFMQCMSLKQKIVHGRGTSNLNLGVFICSFYVCRASYPFSSINYGWVTCKIRCQCSLQTQKSCTDVRFDDGSLVLFFI